MVKKIFSSKPRKIDFEFEGKALAVRKLPLRLGLKMQAFAENDSVPPEIVAEIIADCVVDKNGQQVWSIDDVLGFDMEPMLQIFSEISGSSEGLEGAEKN